MLQPSLAVWRLGWEGISLQHDLQSALTLPQLSRMAASAGTLHLPCASCSGLAASLTHSCPSAVVQLEDGESLVIPDPSTLLQSGVSMGWSLCGEKR